MAEEAVDTPELPPENTGSDGGAETESTPIPEPKAQPPEPPPTLTPEQIADLAAEKAFQKVASWQGRRDKDLFDNLGNLIDTRLSNIRPPEPQAPIADVNVFDDPDKWARTVVPRILDEEVNRRTKADQAFTSEVIRIAGKAMDTDPLYADAALGKEVVEEIQKNFSSLDKRNRPEVEAERLVMRSYQAVQRRKMQKQNALAGNKPANAPIGTVTPPARQSNKPASVNLSKEAAALAKRWNYSPEELAKVFKE